MYQNMCSAHHIKTSTVGCALLLEHCVMLIRIRDVINVGFVLRCLNVLLQEVTFSGWRPCSSYLQKGMKRVGQRRKSATSTAC